MAMANDYKFCNNKKHHITSPQIHGAAVLNKLKLTSSTASGSALASNTLSCGLILTMSAKALLMAFLPPPAQQPGMAVVF